MSVNITHAVAIEDGWMSESELTWLAEQAQTHDSIVELGSYLGRSTLALAEHTRGTVYAVDDWVGPRAPVDSWWPWSKTKEFMESMFERFCANMGGFIGEGKVVPIRANHRCLPSELPEPDMVFIDGDHAYESVIADIEFWKPRVKAGGILCGHDYWQPQVAKAVDSILGVTNHPADSIWSITV